MNDFAEKINGRIGRNFGKIFFGGVSQVDGALDAVAKAEFLRQFYREIIGREDAAMGADAFDQFRALSFCA
jgi:hypothetical protein